MFQHTDVYLYDLAVSCRYFPVVIARVDGKLKLKAILTLAEGSSCYYLQNNRCVLYSLDRPLGCKQFPFLELDQEELTITYDLRCHRVSKSPVGYELLLNGGVNHSIIEEFGGAEYYGRHLEVKRQTSMFLDFCEENRLLKKLEYVQHGGETLDLTSFLPSFAINEERVGKLSTKAKNSFIDLGYYKHISYLLGSISNFFILLKQLKGDDYVY
jgi:hypothetical protein